MTKIQLSQVSPVVEVSELMTLAGKISTSAMQVIAVQRLEFDISEVKTLSSANREDQWMMKFELLDRWKNRNRRNSRWVSQPAQNVTILFTFTVNLAFKFNYIYQRSSILHFLVIHSKNLP